jgi:hypothetical protein
MPRHLRLPVIPALCVLLVLACSSAAPVDPGLGTARPPQAARQAPLMAEPQQQTREITTGWQISPAAGYADSFGYMILDYAPPEKLREAPAARAGRGSIPAGGRLTIRMGRLNIAHANTIWYAIEVSEGSRSLVRLKGEDGIPNVRGQDGNWWNDLDIDLSEPVAREIRVTVEDAKIGASYIFTLRRLVRQEDRR